MGQPSSAPAALSAHGKRMLVIACMQAAFMHLVRFIYVTAEDATDSQGYFISNVSQTGPAAIITADLVFEIISILAAILTYMGTVQVKRRMFLRIGLALAWISVGSLMALHGAEAHTANYQAKEIPQNIAAFNKTMNEDFKDKIAWLQARTAAAIVFMVLDMFIWGYIMMSGSSIVYHVSKKGIMGGFSSLRSVFSSSA